MIGLDASGKTSFLYRAKLGESVCTIPTIGFNVETMVHKSTTMCMYDVGGGDKVCTQKSFYLHSRYVVYGNIIQRV